MLVVLMLLVALVFVLMVVVLTLVALVLGVVGCADVGGIVGWDVKIQHFPGAVEPPFRKTYIFVAVF